MQGNFEVRGWGPAPGLPLTTDVLSSLSDSPRRHLRRAEREGTSNGKAKERSTSYKRALYCLGSISQAKLCDGVEQGS